jgi:tetratricopeptide (TPR) repeat protein
MNHQSFKIPVDFTYASFFFLILLATVGLYWIGFSPLFILDDEPNLNSLSSITDSEWIVSMGRFVTEGDAGRLGRPISLLTFALQFYDWPNDAESFKYVNLMIHLLNGCLIFWLLLLLTRTLSLSYSRQLLLASVTTAIWLLHPLQVTTVLYVVQRMVQLSVLFTLIGLISYVQGRYDLAQGQLVKGFIKVSLGIGLGGILATLSKENGVLLVFYVLALETTLLQSVKSPPYWRVWFAMFIYLPITLLCLYFAMRFDRLLQDYVVRDFTMGERLLTEARILIDYLAKILLLHPTDFGLFQDDYPMSRGLLTPWTTLPAVLFVITSFIIGIRQRRIWPLLSFAIFWFFAGHFLESSFIALIPYFEHRNYLSMLGILFAVVYGGLVLIERISALRPLVITFSIIWLLLFPLLTSMQTTLWANPLQQAILWAQEKPLSRYAQSHVASLLVQIDRPEEAEKYYRQMVKNFPQDTGHYTFWLNLACLYPERVKLPEAQAMLEQFRTAKLDIGALSGLRFLIDSYAKGTCQTDAETLEVILKSLLDSPMPTPYRADLYFIYGTFCGIERRYTTAVDFIDQGLALKYEPYLRLRQIAWLMTDHQLDKASIYLNKAKSEFNPVATRLYSQHFDFLEKEIERLKQET